MVSKSQKDNSTLYRKLRLRRSALALIDAPVVMETHGGIGQIYNQVYRDIPDGVVFEKESKRTLALAKQRPTWAVYECDCVKALSGGVGNHLEINLLDVDPYGDPWDAIAAFLGSDRPFPETLHIVVNDGARQNVQIGGAWRAESLKPIVARFGNDLYHQYLAACKLLMSELAQEAGYTLDKWHGYYCGYNGGMTHYWAILQR